METRNKTKKSTAKCRKQKNLEMEVEKVGTRQQFSRANVEIAFLNNLTSKILNLKNNVRKTTQFVKQKLKK